VRGLGERTLAESAVPKQTGGRAFSFVGEGFRACRLQSSLLALQLKQEERGQLLTHGIANVLLLFLHLSLSLSPSSVELLHSELVHRFATCGSAKSGFFLIGRAR